MSVRELVVLGTASQVPTRYRSHNSCFLRFDNEGFLFDPGECTQRQMIFADVTATSITKVLITHFHGDHCLGFAGVSQRLSLDRVPHPIDVFFPASGRVYYDRLRRASIYHNTVTQRPHPISQEGLIFENDKLTIEARKLEHGGIDVYGYRIQEKDRVTMLPEKLQAAGVRGRLIGELQRNGEVEVDGKTIRREEVSVPKKGQSIAFVMDTRLCPNVYELAQDADMLVIESTYVSTESKEAKAYGHMTAAQSATVAKECGVNQLVLTHFSQRYPRNDPFEQEAKPIFEDVVVARDCKRVPLKRPPRD